MNWEAFGAIGEVIGAIAVVVTLLFLIAQLRQNTRALEETREATIAQLYQSRAQLHMEGTLRKAEAFGFKAEEILPKLRSGVESLSDEERLYIFQHEYADAIRLDNGLFLFSKGFMEEDFHAYVENAILGKRSTWESLGLINKFAFRQGFIDEVHKIWSRGDGA